MARVLGLTREGNWATTDFAFDVLSLEALFLVLDSLATLISGSPSVFFSGPLAVLRTTFTKYSPPLELS